LQRLHADSRVARPNGHTIGDRQRDVVDAHDANLEPGPRLTFEGRARHPRTYV
jgi:hypothetical protein